MPTVIDSLIVTLGLDPSGFTEGQRQMAANLRRMEENARRANQNIQRSGHGIVSFFRGLESPLGSLRQHFEKLATATATPQKNLAALARQSQQTGQALTVAQRNYDAVVKSAEQSGMRLHSLGQQGRRTGQEVEAGALQGAAGLRVMGVAGLTAVAAFMALNKIRSSATDTARNLFGVGVGAAGAGIPIQQYTAISQALLHQGNVPEAESGGWLSQIRSAQVQAQHGDASQAAALAVGLAQAGVTGVNAFTDNPEKILDAIAARFHSVSADTAIGLGAMVGQSNALALALHNLGDVGLEEQIQLERQRSATDAQSQAARDLTLAQSNLDISWQNLSRRIGEEIDPALSRFDDLVAHVLDRLSGKDASDIARTAALSLVPGGAAAASGLNLWDRVKGWFGGRSASTSPTAASIGSVSSNVQGGATGALLSLGISPGSPEWQIAMRESRGNPNIGWAGLAGSADYSPGGTDLSKYPLDSTGFPMWMGKMGPAGNSTAAGLFMITGTNWHKYAPALGIHDFSSESQYRVQQAMVAANHGYGDWAASGTTNFPITDAGISAAHLRSIQSTQAGGSSTTHTTTNDVDINGGVHVYGTNTSGGYQTGGAIADALHSQLLTNQINTGQQ